MKLKSILLGVAAASLLIQTGAQARTLDEVRADKSLAIVTTASAPPHGFKNPKSNQLEGIMVDVAAGVAKHLKVSDKLSDVPFSGLIPTLTSGRADVMSAPLFITEERARAIDFSAPVYEWGEGVVVSDKAAKKYAKFEDMQGLSLIHI